MKAELAVIEARTPNREPLDGVSSTAGLGLAMPIEGTKKNMSSVWVMLDSQRSANRPERFYVRWTPVSRQEMVFLKVEKCTS